MASTSAAATIGANYYRFLLILAGLFGLVYVFLVPPWQHNDEPGHFEYAWLAANQETWPQRGDYNQPMRREVAASMIEHGFFNSREDWPNLLLINEPVWIGISQVGDPPLYYVLASMPLRLFRYTDITFQLYSARFISYFLYLLTVWLAVLASREMFSNHRLLAMGLPAFFALLPGFIDLMTAVNDDVMAVTAMTFFFLAGIRLLKYGFTFRHLVFLSLGVGWCMLAKRTSWLALPLGVFVVYLGLVKNRAWAILAGIVVAGILGGAASISWRETTPAYYYARLNGSQPVRTASPDAVEGASVFVTVSRGGAFHQTLGQNRVKPLREKEITFGFWAWATEPIRIGAPTLAVRSVPILNSTGLDLTTQPRLFVYNTHVPEDARTLVLNVPMETAAGGIDVYWDCFFLVEGVLNESQEIIPKGENCSRVSVDDTLLNNYIKNGSAENGWPLLRSEVAQWVDRHFSFSVAHLWAVFDMDAAEDYFFGTATHLFRTFWGRFGWGQVPLLGGKPYRMFVFLTGMAILGLIAGVFFHRRSIDWRLVAIMGAAVILQAGLVLFRAAGNWYNYIYTPNARYFYPALYPMAVILSTGWFHLLKIIFQKPLEKVAGVYIFSGLMLVFNLWAWLSIWRHFYG